MYNGREQGRKEIKGMSNYVHFGEWSKTKVDICSSEIKSRDCGKIEDVQQTRPAETERGLLAGGLLSTARAQSEPFSGRDEGY
jgi:hypothetical protein